MRSFVAALPVLLLASACGGTSDTVAPTAMATPTTAEIASAAPETPSAPSSTAEPAEISETASPELDQAFVAAVRDFVATEWAGWSDGVILGECLAANASLIGAPAKQGVIEYGLEDVYNHVSRTDSYTLGIVWDTCEQDGGTTATTLPDMGSTTTALADISDPELDETFSTAVRIAISEGWSEGESIGDCLVANASQITSAAKRGVIDYGLGEVFNYISLTDRSSLGMILEFCGAQRGSAAVSSGVLAATCILDVELVEVSCQASGHSGDSTLTWSSTAEYSGKTGGARSGAASWVFPVVRLWDSIIYADPDNDPPGVTPGAANAAGHQEGQIDLPVPPEIRVSLESCKDSDCQKAETSIDAAELMSEDTSGLERIEIVLPFDVADPISGIIPMGETIDHPFAGGHPGIDLLWPEHPDGRPEIFASATGTVTRAYERAADVGGVVTDHILLNVQMRHEGFDKAYFTTYGGLALDFAHELGDTVQKGELLGHIDANPYEEGRMIHWEFGYYLKFLDEENGANDRRVCPLTFLDEASRVVMEEVWEAQPADAYKDAFPYICSNVYFGRNE